MVSAIFWSCVLLSVGPLNIHRVCCLPAAEAQSLLSSLWCFSAGSHLRNLAIPGLHGGQLSYNVFRHMFRRESREISGNMNKTDGDDNSETALLEEASCASYLQKLAVSLHSCGALLHALWRLLYLSSACCFGHWRHWPTIWKCLFQRRHCIAFSTCLFCAQVHIVKSQRFPMRCLIF